MRDTFERLYFFRENGHRSPNEGTYPTFMIAASNIIEFHSMR